MCSHANAIVGGRSIRANEVTLEFRAGMFEQQSYLKRHWLVGHFQPQLGLQIWFEKRDDPAPANYRMAPIQAGYWATMPLGATSLGGVDDERGNLVKETIAISSESGWKQPAVSRERL